jgi:hypothetical protein
MAASCNEGPIYHQKEKGGGRRREGRNKPADEVERSLTATEDVGSETTQNSGAPFEFQHCK